MGETTWTPKRAHIDILRHCRDRAVGQMFCGDSPAMQELVAAGFMRPMGRVAWCPDPYFRITQEGHELLAATETIP